MKSVELFAGAGGLALGTARAGFEHHTVIECAPNAVQTLETNRANGVEHVKNWNIFRGFVEEFDFTSLPDDIALVSGGPPCQPFSLGGKHRAFNDKRDMFPVACEVIRKLKPKAFLFENVKGLLRSSFEPYFTYVINRLRYPDHPIKGKEDWQDHSRRLDKYHKVARKPSAEWYRVGYALLNAADFGIPQRRERVFIVGIRADINQEFEFPVATHSEDSLILSKWITGEYWREIGIRHGKKFGPEPREARRAQLISKNGLRERAEVYEPWKTVRQALGGLTPLSEGQTDPNDPNHFLNPGAKSYKGHTGSAWDYPAKTLKAGDHGVPGGENTVRLNGNGDVRYFSVREAARLQTFPDEYYFEGAWTEGMRQLGNAVPVELAFVVASKLASLLSPYCG